MFEGFVNLTKDLQKVYEAEPNKEVLTLVMYRLSTLIVEKIVLNTSSEEWKKCDFLTELENAKSNPVQLKSVLVQKDFKGSNSVNMAHKYQLKFNVLVRLLDNFYQFQVKENASTQFRQMFLNSLSLYYNQEKNTISMKDIKDQVPYPVFKEFDDFVKYCDDQHVSKIEISGIVFPAIPTLESDVRSYKPNYTVDDFLNPQPRPLKEEPPKSMGDLNKVTDSLQRATFD
ncbi:hypothetical protein EIN_487740 [Entamoeba invadens IP1]|uniref:Uncharacterized protein n=1 Tax=Entamoeba invadens IP1 TaxID=370355 RepID=A0A0A1U4T0_ENTIV|nr:hypothetical protein EIN_487740 [Entamoeba invadens IP1]ELP89272.1 hypothetical protein EIN_487740 [Entamoeba invadens IP1]|eukprot:XP_004256043.1 hypothetical protein EIN_487740 [Entamoeba invadens IP1]